MTRRRRWRLLQQVVTHLLTAICACLLVWGLLLRPRSAFSPSEEMLADRLSQSVVRLGIKWKDNEGSPLWVGTGFLIERNQLGVTAGHVINELLAQSNDLNGRDLHPTFVCGTTDGKIHEIGGLRVHPGVISRSGSELTPSPDDLGLFRWVGEGRPKNLKLASQPARVGQVIWVAGFPAEIETLKSIPRLGPTFKSGRVERLVWTTKSGPANIIQHGLPLGGGFSGSPLVNLEGEVVGIVNNSSHVHLMGSKLSSSAPPEPLRILNPGDINFAVPVQQLSAWLDGTH